MSFLAFAGLVPASALEVGQPAPEVNSFDESGQAVRLSEFYDRGTVLLYFYPKSGTPGCTAQACALRDNFADLQARGVQIVGVSGDKPAGQKKFRDDHRLPFTLLADADGKVAKAFGVPSFLGFTKRQSFLIKQGKLVWRDLSVSPKNHVSAVIKALDAL